MLKLLYAVACENVIVSDTGTTSLISVLERMEAEVPPNLPEPPIAIGMRWHVIAFWTRGDISYETPVHFEQRTVVNKPDGQTFADIVVPFVVSNTHRNFRNVGVINGFPITKDGGVITVDVFLRKKGDEEWVKYSEYPILTEIKIAEVVNANETEIKHPNNEVSVKS